ncbi:hypothetical protein PISMIDRAFT_328685 [Pisolithus microcarpus 441]|uniref:Uncharacterized protein n=1 Tax=Pisolithus microcarpus 441 TaxID=765257 RepID=A0A0C9XSM7_9AGAM|nr:hypothetical protein PISMIDRAFT_328685 [Pisolithus microcarpus 441]
MIAGTHPSSGRPTSLWSLERGKERHIVFMIMAPVIWFYTFLKPSTGTRSHDQSRIVFFTIKVSMKTWQCSILVSVTIPAPDYTAPQVPAFSSA